MSSVIKSLILCAVIALVTYDVHKPVDINGHNGHNVRWDAVSPDPAVNTTWHVYSRSSLPFFVIGYAMTSSNPLVPVSMLGTVVALKPMHMMFLRKVIPISSVRPYANRFCGNISQITDGIPTKQCLDDLVDGGFKANSGTPSGHSYIVCGILMFMYLTNTDTWLQLFFLLWGAVILYSTYFGEWHTGPQMWYGGKLAAVQMWYVVNKCVDFTPCAVNRPSLFLQNARQYLLRLARRRSD